MSKTFKSISAIILVLVLVFTGMTTAFADDTAVTYNGGGDFSLTTDSELEETSLFPDLEGAMPGDVLTQNVVVTNDSSETDYVNIYLRAEAHDESSNPLETIVQDTETVASMSDFLAQLQMKVYNGDELIYESSPDQEDGLSENVRLGSFAKGESTTLRVELTVPAELGNEYANRSGEVDWIFTVEELNNSPSLEVEKEVTNEPIEADGYTEGETIEYSITVKNTGNVDFLNAVVTDPLTGDEWTNELLAVGESQTFTASYTVTAEDAEAGTVKNTATATATPDNPDLEDMTAEDSVESDTKVKEPGLTLTKTSTSKPKNGKFYVLGENISYEIKAENTGNVVLKNVEVNDELTGDSWTIEELKPGESKTFVTTYTVTQADVDAGKVVNSVTGKGSTDYPDDPLPEDDDDEEDPTGEDNPGLNVSKVSTSTPKDGKAYTEGETISYKITVSNTGEWVIRDLVVTDDLTGNTWTLAELQPGEVVEYTTTHIVTAEDVEAGHVYNKATAKGKYGDGDDPIEDEDDDDEDVPTRKSNPSFTIELVETSKPSNPNGYQKGETITYDAIITNTGDTTLINIVITDPETGETWTIDKLEPGESVTLTGKITHVVTKEDVARGYVDKQVTGKGIADNGEQTEVTAESNIVRSKTWTPGKPAKTGDDFDPKLWIGLMVGAAAVVIAVLIILFVVRRRRKE